MAPVGDVCDDVMRPSRLSVRGGGGSRRAGVAVWPWRAHAAGAAGRFRGGGGGGRKNSRRLTPPHHHLDRRAATDHDPSPPTATTPCTPPTQQKSRASAGALWRLV